MTRVLFKGTLSAPHATTSRCMRRALPAASKQLAAAPARFTADPKDWENTQVDVCGNACCDPRKARQAKPLPAPPQRRHARRDPEARLAALCPPAGPRPGTVPCPAPQLPETAAPFGRHQRPRGGGTDPDSRSHARRNHHGRVHHTVRLHHLTVADRAAEAAARGRHAVARHGHVRAA